MVRREAGRRDKPFDRAATEKGSRVLSRFQAATVPEIFRATPYQKIQTACVTHVAAAPGWFRASPSERPQNMLNGAQTAVDDDLPRPVQAAQRRVTRAISELAPPAGFAVLIEVLATEMAANGLIPGSPMFEPFLQMQISALIQRVRGICVENGVELVEEEIEATPPQPRSWWRRWVPSDI
jgi:hypothetical protein